MIDRRRFIQTKTLVIPCFLISSSAITADEPNPQLGDCGTAAIYALLQLEGRTATFDAVAAKLGRSRPGGHSMQELREAAHWFGLRLDGVFIGKKADLIDRPVLAFLKVDRDGHFLVVRPVGHTKHLVQVIDSNQQTRVIEKSELVASDQWTGLILSPRRTDWTIAAAIGLLTPTCVSRLMLAHLRRRRFRNSVFDHCND